MGTRRVSAMLGSWEHAPVLTPRTLHNHNALLVAPLRELVRGPFAAPFDGACERDL